MKLKKPLLCRLGFHKWRDYGGIVEVFWPEVTYVQEPPRLGSQVFSDGEAVHERRGCKRCGTKLRRRLVTNSEGTLSCVGWEPDTEETDKEQPTHLC